jgi:DNA-binding XRE family transcriptional regulator
MSVELGINQDDIAKAIKVTKVTANSKKGGANTYDGAAFAKVKKALKVKKAAKIEEKTEEPAQA